MTRWQRRVAVVALPVLALLVASTATYLGVARSMRSGVRLGHQGLAAAQDGDAACAAQLLTGSAASFSSAAGGLRRWWTEPMRFVPLVGAQLRAAHRLAAAGAEASAAAASTAGRASRLRMSDMAVDLASVAGLTRSIEGTVSALSRALTEARRARSRWMHPALRRRLGATVESLERAIASTRTAGEATRLLDNLLGGQGERRYFVAIQNPAEQRAGGGILGNYMELVARDGRLLVERLGRNEDFVGTVNTRLAGLRAVGPRDFQIRYRGFGPEHHFVNAALSPDFPTVAKVIEDLYRRFGGRSIDGVISVDPIALSALLEVVGPVTVPGWPVPLTSTTAAKVLLHDHYLHLDGEQREMFLLGVASAILERLATADLPPGPALVRALAPAVASKHLMLHGSHPSEQRLLGRLGMTGKIPPVRGDFLQVVTQNSGQNKIDWFQRRAIAYDASFEPTTGAIVATASIHLTNTAPSSSALPDYVLGGPGYPVARGHSRSWVSVYSPLRLEGATLDGAPIAPDQQTELGRQVYSYFVDVAPGATTVLRLHLRGILPAGTTYRLDVGQQPTITPDRLHVSVAAGSWSLSSARNLRFSDGHGVAMISSTKDTTFEGTFGRSAGRRASALNGPVVVGSDDVLYGHC